MNFNLDKFRYQVSDCLADVKQTLSVGFGARIKQSLIWSFSLTLGWGASIPATLAAEQVTLRLGALEQKIEVEDLEQFAKTGKLSDSLQLLGLALTPDVREAMNRRIELEPKLADELIDEWVRSPRGKQLVAALGLAIPDSTIPQLQGAIALAARQVNGLTFLGFLRAYPEENITLDLSQLLDLVLQFNLSYSPSAISPWLEDAVNRDSLCGLASNDLDRNFATKIGNGCSRFG